MLLSHRRDSSCSRYEMSHAQHLKWFNFLEFQSFSVRRNISPYILGLVYLDGTSNIGVEGQ